jgi:hypothetical protein
VTNGSAILGGILLAALLVLLLWGVVGEWWRHRPGRHHWTTRDDAVSVGRTGLEEPDELGFVEDGEP